MRDCLNNRGGFDRVLAVVAATFLTVSATSAMAQDPSRSTAAELAIDAAVPRPEPANLPPPTPADFKMDTTASITSPAEAKPSETKPFETKPSDTKPADVATTPPPAPAPAADSAMAPSVPLSVPLSASTASPAVTPAAPATPAAASATPAATPATATATPDASAPATAAAPAAEPAHAASNVPAADQPVADKLKDLLASRNLRDFERKAERADVEKFYAARDYAPLWTQAGALTANAKGVIARLKDAASDGLNANDYPLPDFAAATTPDALADADLKLTSSMLDYARQAQSGRMHWSQVSNDIQYPDHPTNPSEVLTHVTTASDSSAALDSYNPPQKLYQELKKKLAELRGQGDGPVITIADGPTLKYTAAHGKKQAEVVVEDQRVPQLRAKLGVAENADDTHYDANVAEAVRRFQEGVDLPATGALDNRTVAAINSPKRDKQIDTVVVNMERWRWLPRDLGAEAIGDAYVILNIPDYTLKVMQHGAQIWTTKVVTGKPGIHATPLLTETMKYITVNPTWNVPPSITYGEYLPALQQDPTVLQRMGLRVEQNRDGTVHISQPPGDGNALGRVRFNFPNKFLVYQHDTPDKYLFEKSERAYSHGCMRVQYPDQYASVLLNIEEPDKHWTAERIRGMYGSNEQDLKFATPIPVNITYQTAFVDDAGKLQIRKDIYGRDASMISMLKGSHNHDMEAVVARSVPSSGPRPGNTTLPPGVIASANPTGPSLFERLFGPSTPPAPVGRRAQQPQQNQRRIFTR
jgi:murein L,D-transpeptidase YcbB/YkuD